MTGTLRIGRWACSMYRGSYTVPTAGKNAGGWPGERSLGTVLSRKKLAHEGRENSLLVVGAGSEPLMDFIRGGDQMVPGLLVMAAPGIAPLFRAALLHAGLPRSSKEAADRALGMQHNRIIQIEELRFAIQRNQLTNMGIEELRCLIHPNTSFPAGDSDK
ncbi:hypothetical protein J2T17_002126 [Paenibacillus mucilaginosus]|uniref:hypothetical protein n=1 Tax=Paenibacillus mucilaginosus TaxID=61624 RepID=UPI003D19FFB9